MIDLHTHTDESDGSLSPAQLVQAAVEAGLEALGITDHDTFAGYDRALQFARDAGLDLVCGIELSTKYRGRSVHLLGYFPGPGPSDEFRRWIGVLQSSRHRRNQELVDKLRSHGFQITLEEVRRRGRGLPGRPHFAAILVEKGYVSSMQQAFDEYLDESGACYVSRDEPAFEDAAGRIVEGGGLPSLPHPIRVSRDFAVLEGWVRDMRGLGLRGIEVYHSDHAPAEVDFYTSLASRLSLAISGGSDFHGTVKPRVKLGTGIDGNLNIPRAVLDDLRRLGNLRAGPRGHP